ncbi:MAG: hypothetical protein ACP5NY_07860 [Thermocladium sp.]
MGFWGSIVRNKPFMIGVILGILAIIVSIYVEFHPYSVRIIGSGVIMPGSINSTVSFSVPPTSIVVVQLGNGTGNLTVSYYSVVPDTNYTVPSSTVINSTDEYHFFTMITNMTLSNASASMDYRVYELNRTYIFWVLLWLSLILFIATIVLVVFGFSQIINEVYREKLKSKK